MPNLTFGKLPLGKLSLGACFLENAVDKVNMNVAGNSKVINYLDTIKFGWLIPGGRMKRKKRNIFIHSVPCSQIQN